VPRRVFNPGITGHRLFYPILAVVLFMIGALRISATYHVFSGVYDEPIHFASGMQWLDQGKYEYEAEHPPLATVLLAVGPYLKGLRSHSLVDPVDEGNSILDSGGEYLKNLALARAGNLPFLALATVAIFMWARRWFSDATGFWALLLFLNLPAVLGHAGLATLDIACTGSLIAALYWFLRWLEKPGLNETIWLGVASAVAVLSKFAVLPFFSICAAVAIGMMILVDSAGAKQYAASLRAKRMLLATGLLAAIVFAGYRFALIPYATIPALHVALERKLAAGTALREWAAWGENMPLPFTKLVLSFGYLIHHSLDGHESFLLGQQRMTGWWYFFPVVLFFKNPLGFLALTVAGIAATLRGFGSRSWQQIATALFPLAILAFCMLSKVDLGVRHILPIYPFMALIAGDLIVRAFACRKAAGIACAAVAASVIVSAALAHPDYMAYFNIAAGAHPERILVESDLDWGQDLHRLANRLKALGVKEVSLQYFGSAPVETAGLPTRHAVSRTEITQGWVAISVRYLGIDFARDGSFGWLKSCTPVERIGKSIFLYRIGD
jgi:hypothetical protein